MEFIAIYYWNKGTQRQSGQHGSDSRDRENQHNPLLREAAGDQPPAHHASNNGRG